MSISPISTSLATLPPELVNCVVANIESQSTLYNLVQCSRQFYACTIPHLYRHVKIQEEIGLRREMRHNGPLRKLASTIVRSPSLAGLVQCFSLCISDPRGIWVSSEESEDFEFVGNFEEFEESPECGDSEEYEENVRPEVFKLDQAWKAAVNAWSVSEEDKNDWLRKLCHPCSCCYHDLILALLLPLLLRVERVLLDVTVGFEIPFLYFERMMRRAVHREKPLAIQPPFEALRVFVHSQNNESTELSTRLRRSLPKLPAIRVFFLPDKWYDGDGFQIDFRRAVVVSGCTAEYLVPYLMGLPA